MRFLATVIITFLLLTGGGGAFVLHNRLEIANWALFEFVNKLGFPNLGFKVAFVEWGHVGLREIEAGPDLKIGSVELGFSLDSLRNGSVETIKLDDVMLDVSTPDEGTLGKIQQILQSQEKSSNSSIVMPRISLENLVLKGKRGPTKFNFILKGSLEPDMSGIFSARGDASFLVDGQEIQLSGLAFKGRGALGSDEQVVLDVDISHALLHHDVVKLKADRGHAQIKINPISGETIVALSALSLQNENNPVLFNQVVLTGQAQVLNQKTTVEISVKLAQEQEILSLLGHYDGAGGQGELELKTPIVQFSPKGLQPRDLSPFLDVVSDVEGGVSAQSRMAWSQSNLDVTGHLNFFGLSLLTDTVSLKGLKTRLHFSNLMPPRTLSIQRLQAEEVSSGLSLSKPVVDFSIDGPFVQIHKIQAGFMGGDLFIKDMRLEPGGGKQDIRLQLSEIDLEKLFGAIDLDGVKATGKISGIIPLTILGDQIVIEAGLLENDAPGTIQFRSEKAKQALGGAGEQVDLLLRVLNNFDYNRLSLKVDREKSHNARLILHLEGRNPIVMQGREFHLNINLEGNVDKLLQSILEGYRLSDRAIRASLGAR